MKLRLLAPAAVLALAGLAVAGDAPTYDLSRHDKFQVGDTVTTTSKLTLKQHQTKTAEDGTVEPDSTTTEVTSVRAVQKVLAVDDKGRATKVRVHLAEWSQQQGEDKDESIQGALVEVTGVGKGRTWALLGEGVTPTEGATKWLTEEWSKDEEAIQDVMLPKQPIAVGETWSPSVADVMAAGLGETLTVDAEKSKVTGKLESVQGDLATLSMTIDLTVTTLQGLPLSKGAMKLSGAGPKALTARIGEGTTHNEMTLEGDASVPEEGKTKLIHFSISHSQDETIKVGGEVPEPK